MSDLESEEIPKVYRIAVVPVITFHNDSYLLLLKTRSRNEWETPGGQIERGEDIASTARRELQEETGLKQNFEIRHITNQGPWRSINVTSGSGKKVEINPWVCIAEITVPTLPPISLPPESEHIDYLYVKIPHFERIRDYRDSTILGQVSFRKLVLSRIKNHLAVLNPQANWFNIHSRQENISEMTKDSLGLFFSKIFVG